MIRRVYFFVLLLVSSFSVLAGFSPITVCGHEPEAHIPFIYHKLHYGLTWFHGNNPDVQAYCQQFVPGHPNLFFQKFRQNSLIMIHGWSPATVDRHWRINFNANDFHGPDVKNTAAAWLSGTKSASWNIGVFYWNQFADEMPASDTVADMVQAVSNAEQKIWRRGLKPYGVGLRWRDDQGVYHPSFIHQNMAQLFYKNYVAAFRGYQGHVRIVGESLGAQLTIAGAMEIDKHHLEDGVPLPTQIVLLDPVFTPVKYPFLNDKTTYDVALKDVIQLKKDGVIVTGFRTSSAGTNAFMRDNTALLNQTVFSNMVPCVYDLYDVQHRHETGVWWYMLSYGLDRVPVDWDSKLSFVSSAPYAGSSLQYLREYMGDDKPMFTSAVAYNNSHFCIGGDDNFLNNIVLWPKWHMSEKPKDLSK